MRYKSFEFHPSFSSVPLHKLITILPYSSHIQTEEQPSALLDLRFNPNAGKEDICAAVSSTSTLALFKLDPSLNRPLSHIKTMDMTTMSNGALTPEPETEVLFLAFAWHPSKADMVAITTNTGHVYIVDLGDVNGSWEMHSKPVITHDLEAWCVSIAPCIDPAIPSYENAFILYSGGDDSILRSQTCVLEKEQEPQSEPTRYAIDRSLPPSKLRGHDAGVTAILPLHPKAGKPSLVVTGSYDDHIRLFSLSSTSPYSPLRAQNLAESNLGGGVWRLKLIDMDNEHSGDRRYLWRARILASCMHVGARVVELLQTADDEYSFRTVGRFEEHQSMNYGSDFHPGSVASNKLTVVSSSFYDKLMCLWEMEL